MQQVRFILVLLTLSISMPTTLWAQGMLEVPPPPQSFQSGVGYISGWYCNLPETDTITVRFNNDQTYTVPYGGRRGDTRPVCGGTADNGFIMQFNWNLLGDGLHTVEVFAGGELFGSAEVRVTTLGEEFLRDVSAMCEVEDFPQPGLTTVLSWQQASQNFVIQDVQGPPTGTFAGSWEGMTSQGLPIGLTVNDANRITRLDFTYQQLGEIPPDPNCRSEISVLLSAPISTDGAFSVTINIPPEANSVENTRLDQFEGTLSGSLGNSEGIGQWNFTQALFFCQRNPSQSATAFCGSESFPCDEFDFGYDLSRIE